MTKQEEQAFDLVVIMSLYAGAREDRAFVTDKTLARLKAKLITFCRDTGISYDKVAGNLAVRLSDIEPDYSNFSL